MNVGGGVQRIEITERESPVFGGAEFAGVGNYERLHGTVFGELDPAHRLNAGIVNLGYGTKDNPLAPQGRPCIRRALGFGISQSGRVLRDLVYLGFNEDFAGRPAFDGILPVVAGSRRTCINWQFDPAIEN
jgi:hypothetical protein